MSKKILSKKKKNGPLADCTLLSTVPHDRFCLLAVWDLSHTFKAPAVPQQSVAQACQCSALKLVVLSLEASCFCSVSCLLDATKRVREEKSNSTPCQRNRLAGCSVARHLF